MMGKTLHPFLSLFLMLFLLLSPMPQLAPASSLPAGASKNPAAAITAAPTLTPTLDASGLPPRAEVKGMWGYGQLFALSCEARSSADWARHFGIDIRELKLLAAIPHSDNPEAGFVGSLNGGWGNIPPDSYGVHAGPVAKALRDTFGAQAAAMRHMTFDHLRREIAAGRPVVVWVTGHVQPGKGEKFVIDKQTITVARYEHTVIVIGYDEKNVKILDGKTIYQRPIATFLKAWSPLENMAILWDERSLGKEMERRAVKQEYAHGN